MKCMDIMYQCLRPIFNNQCCGHKYAQERGGEFRSASLCILRVNSGGEVEGKQSRDGSYTNRAIGERSGGCGEGLAYCASYAVPYGGVGKHRSSPSLDTVQFLQKPTTSEAHYEKYGILPKLTSRGQKMRWMRVQF